jgi:hypothetical protein
MQDAVNLGWKLAAQLQGWAPSGLLDTYHDERHPVGAAVLEWTRAQLVLMAPGQHVSDLRNLFADLLTIPEVQRRIAELSVQGDVRYPMPTVDCAAHPAVGGWAPDLLLETAGGTEQRVSELLRTARAVVVDLEGAYGDLVVPYRGRVEHTRATTTAPAAPSLLVRPDGYVAWAADTASDQARTELRHALSAWFGEPGPVS